MNYQEAIYCMKVMADEEVCEDCNYYQLCDHTKQADMARIAISAMQELREYKENEKRNLPRTNRLMDECTYRHENRNCLKIGGFCTSVPTSHCQRYKELHNEYTEYKKLGTLEEVREAVELQQADKPRILRLSIHGAPDGDLYSCPNCEYRIIKKDHRGFYSGPRTKCCPNCGKRLDWGEEDD